MAILVTGGAGYIGSHTLVELIEQNREVVVIDNLSNASAESLRRIQMITGILPRLYLGDLQDPELLQRIFSNHNIESVVHFAGLKSVGESVSEPLHYYRNNLESTLVLCEQMRKHGVFRLVFSSSATVYGDTEQVPVTEDTPMNATNPYGRTKQMIEQILTDVAQSDPRWAIVCLRYFNPAGAHYSGLIGEDPCGTPNNLLPFICHVAVGRQSCLSVFGNDYDTPDGTGIRDFIHVSDLATAHARAVDFSHGHSGFHAINLGTGRGYSVLELVDTFERVCCTPIPYQIKDRRTGDIGKSWASADLARIKLNWQAEKTIDQMVRDSWRWQSQNPSGYEQTIEYATTIEPAPTALPQAS